jgi:hypothetical protein
MLDVHLAGSFHVSQPAFRLMRSRGYGRFVFIASSAGLFGQPQASHYAAAKAGIVGLANVIAIEGAAHGILANSVLPFGYSRMVTETIGGAQVATQSAFLRAIDPELVVPIVVFLASRALQVHPSQLLGCAGRYARVFIGLAGELARRARQQADRRDIAAHLDKLSATEPLQCPDVDLRGRWRASARGWVSDEERTTGRTPCGVTRWTAAAWGRLGSPPPSPAAPCRWRPASPGSRRGPTAE